MIQRPNIALIDDEPDLIESYKDILEVDNDLTSFSSAEDYLLFIDGSDKNPFDIVVTDYQLGEMSGIDMISKAQKTNKNVPFILISGYIDRDTTLLAHGLGAHRILVKPVVVKNLDREIKSLFFETQLEILRKDSFDQSQKLKLIAETLLQFSNSDYSEQAKKQIHSDLLILEGYDTNINTMLENTIHKLAMNRTVEIDFINKLKNKAKK